MPTTCLKTSTAAVQRSVLHVLIPSFPFYRGETVVQAGQLTQPMIHSLPGLGKQISKPSCRAGELMPKPDAAHPPSPTCKHRSGQGPAGLSRTRPSQCPSRTLTAGRGGRDAEARQQALGAHLCPLPQGKAGLTCTPQAQPGLAEAEGCSCDCCDWDGALTARVLRQQILPGQEAA